MHLFGADTPLAHGWKGKERALEATELSTRDEGTGGADGIVIPLQLLSESAYQSVYVAPVYVGPNHNQYLLQVDTGSSDLWIASSSCSTSACNGVGNSKYDSSQSRPTGQSVTVTYAEGEATGPVVWDAVQLGGYSIDNQALIAATTVNAEPLSSSFAGVLGLALPLNSVIAQKIPPTTSDAPDGAALSSNLFGITPASAAPPARFLSVALERPGSDKVSSTLGIGRHPADLVPDPSKIQYSSVIAEAPGSLWWMANVHAITVYVNGQAKHVNLPLSSTGTRGQPSAILDTGVPLIVASPALTYGIYGAMGYSPAADGTVYIPCNMPLNMTITLDDRSEIPIHPLDLTFYPSNDPSAENCIGAIQTPAQIGLTLTQADMILGVPFLRNTYTVLGYDTPAANGSFPPNSGSSGRVQPRLGLMPLTDPATAAAEFHQVRVLRQPITSSGGSSGTSGSAAQPAPKKGLSVGIEVLIGLAGFFGLCFVLFGARLIYMKRRYIGQRRAAAAADGTGSIGGDSKDSYVLNELGYRPASRKSHASAPSEDELRMKRYEEYKRRRELESTYSDSATTRVADADADEDGAADEFGALNAKGPGRDSPEHEAFHDPWGEATLTNANGRPPLPSTLLAADELALPPPTARRGSYTPASPPPAARRTSYTPASPLSHHRTPSGGPGAGTPLLAHTRSYSSPQDSDIGEFGMLFPSEREREREAERPASMAGVGAQGRSRRLGSAGSGVGLGLPASPLLSPAQHALPPSPLGWQPPPPPLSSSSPSPPEPELLLTASPRALEPVFSASRNESRVSVIGHEPS